MRSATVIASSWSWVTMTKVVPSRSCRSINSNCVSSRSFLSSAAIGSSSSRTFGRLASERASATRWRWPPESWSGLRAAQPLELDEGEHLLDARLDRRTRHPVLMQAESDVSGDGEMRKQRVALEHHVDGTAVRRNRRKVLAGEQHLPLVGRLEAGEHAQQRGLAAAGGAEQREELAGIDVEAEPIDRGNAGKALRDGGEPHQRIACVVRPWRCAVSHSAKAIRGFLDGQSINAPREFGKFLCAGSGAAGRVSRQSQRIGLSLRRSATCRRSGRKSERESQMDFQDRSVIVTGGTGALGSAVVGALLEAGASCHIPVFNEAELTHFPHRAHPEGRDLSRRQPYRRGGGDRALSRRCRSSGPRSTSPAALRRGR